VRQQAEFLQMVAVLALAMTSQRVIAVHCEHCEKQVLIPLSKTLQIHHVKKDGTAHRDSVGWYDENYYLSILMDLAEWWAGARGGGKEQYQLLCKECHTEVHKDDIVNATH